MTDVRPFSFVDALAGGGLTDMATTFILNELSDVGIASPCNLTAGPAYLRSVTVEGFRGIGREAKLSLNPGVGLTVVVGANGSGKSSFAEAVERLLTGSIGRSEKAAADELANWRNLHQNGNARLKVVLQGTIDKTETTLTHRWAESDGIGAGATTMLRKGATPEPWSPSTIAEAMGSFPPLLPYARLGAAIRGKPSELFDAFNPLLGLADMERMERALAGRLSAAEALGKTADAAAKTARQVAAESGLAEVGALLAEIDASARSPLGAAELLATDVQGEDHAVFREVASLHEFDEAAAMIDLESIDTLDREIAERSTPEFERAEQLAGLLGASIAFHQSGAEEQCPVCLQGTITDQRQAELVAALGAQQAAMSEVAEFRRERVAVHGRLLEQLPRVPSLVETFHELEDLRRCASELRAVLTDPSWLDPSMALGLIGELGPLVTQARVEAQHRSDDRRSQLMPVIASFVEWGRAEQAAVGATSDRKALTEARKWLKTTIESERARRIEAISDSVLTTWQSLRQTSNVTMGALQLTGVADRPNRKLALSCQVDGMDASARSVLSQGELHALALSLFLPRALQVESPFGFLIIDDPVQALDRRKVDGLAEVLAAAAITRQVVVFTHDDRLVDAVERLDLKADVLRVTRLDGSVVNVDRCSDPVTRALDDAYALMKNTGIPHDVACRAVGAVCRTAVEQCAVRRYRRRSLDQHVSLEHVDEVLSHQTQFWPRISLGLWGEVDDGAADRLRKRSAAYASLFGALNNAGHDLVSRDPKDLLRDTERALTALMGWTR